MQMIIKANEIINLQIYYLNVKTFFLLKAYMSKKSSNLNNSLFFSKINKN